MAPRMRLRRNEHLNQLRRLLHAGDLDAALVHLNVTSPYRFTALLQFDRQAGDSLQLVDKHDPRGRPFAPAPTDRAYQALARVLARARRHAFVVQDARVDLALADDTGEQVMRAWCGVPLVSGRQRVVGTLCHVDFNPVARHAATVQMLHAFSRLMCVGPSQGALSRELHEKLDSLAGMLDLIASTSSGPEQSQDTLAAYAAPLLIEAAALDARRLADFRRHLFALSGQLAALVQRRG